MGIVNAERCLKCNQLKCECEELARTLKADALRYEREYSVRVKELHDLAPMFRLLPGEE